MSIHLKTDDAVETRDDMIDFRAAGPMEQFEIVPIIPLAFGNLDVSFTNSSLWMLIGTVAIIFFFFAATRRAALIPGRVQAMAEVLYEFVSDLVRDTIGTERAKILPICVYAVHLYLDYELVWFAADDSRCTTCCSCIYADQPPDRNTRTCDGDDLHRDRLRFLEKWAEVFQTLRTFGGCPFG